MRAATEEWLTSARDDLETIEKCFKALLEEQEREIPKIHNLITLREAIQPEGQPDASVTLWGSGEPKREFLYAADLADAIRFILEQPEVNIREAAPDGILNIGVGEDLSINDLAKLIQEIVGHEGLIEHDHSKPDGTPRKLVDTSRMDALGWQATTPLREGIQKTYDWYCAHEDGLVVV